MITRVLYSCNTTLQPSGVISLVDVMHFSAVIIKVSTTCRSRSNLLSCNTKTTPDGQLFRAVVLNLYKQAELLRSFPSFRRTPC